MPEGRHQVKPQAPAPAIISEIAAQCPKSGPNWMVRPHLRLAIVRAVGRDKRLIKQ
jgi:hypothetical protein